MPATRHQTNVALLTLLAGIGSVGLLLPATRAMTPAPLPPPLEQQLLKLRRERRDLAASLVKRSRERFERSARREDCHQTLTALRRLLDAELALVELPADRVAVLERHCDAVERLWSLEKTFFEMGRVPFADFEPHCSYPLRDARVRLYEARQRQTER